MYRTAVLYLSEGYRGSCSEVLSIPNKELNKTQKEEHEQDLLKAGETTECSTVVTAQRRQHMAGSGWVRGLSLSWNYGALYLGLGAVNRLPDLAYL